MTGRGRRLGLVPGGVGGGRGWVASWKGIMPVGRRTARISRMNTGSNLFGKIREIRVSIICVQRWLNCIDVPEGRLVCLPLPDSVPP